MWRAYFGAPDLEESDVSFDLDVFLKQQIKLFSDFNLDVVCAIKMFTSPRKSGLNDWNYLSDSVIRNFSSRYLLLSFMIGVTRVTRLAFFLYSWFLKFYSLCYPWQQIVLVFFFRLPLQTCCVSWCMGCGASSKEKYAAGSLRMCVEIGGSAA